MRKVVRFYALMLVLCASVWGQTVSSSLVGTLTDPGDAVIPGVDVQLTDQATGAVRTTQTTTVGIFRFSDVRPGTYTVNIKATGFKSYSQKGINLAASETRDLGRVTLDLGSQVEEVSVTAEATPVQTGSSEKSALVDGDQVNALALRGRDLFGYMRLIPGVVDTGEQADSTGTGSIANININGGMGAKNFTVDGVTNMDTGSNGTIHYDPNLDSISEIRVMTSNYQAEFGRNAGGTISVVTKGGSQEFHGSGWWTHRHEGFNADSFQNNKSNTARAKYRYNIEGFSLGGPAYIPKLFNTQKKRLFFFVSQEYTRQLALPGGGVPGSPAGAGDIRFTLMPTILERGGDFSQSFDASGKLIVVKDPTTGIAFPGNKILDPTRINKYGLAILNFFPKPNYTESDPTQFYNRNFKFQAADQHPRRNDMVRIDMNLTSKLNSYFRWIRDYDDSLSHYQFSSTYDQVIDHPNPGKGYAVGITYTISPTMVNEFLFGKSYNTWDWWPADDIDGSNQNNSIRARAKMSPSASDPLPMWNPIPTSAPANLMRNYAPTIAFGSIPQNAVAYSSGFGGGDPFWNWNDIYSFTDSLSKVAGQHNLKAGIYIERTGKVQYTGPGSYLGSFNFAVDANNPLDSGNGYANALLGNFDSYQEGARSVPDPWTWQVEAYVEDSWRVSRRLTLDLGVRFYHVGAGGDAANHTMAGFDPAAYKTSAIPRLYQPALVNGKRVGLDPATGQTVAQALVGFFVPNTGNPANGGVVGGLNGVPLSLYHNPYLLPAPRVGFAWDVLGNGKTAVRGGIGLFYDGAAASNYSWSGQPPVSYAPTLYYGNINDLTQARGALSPSNSNFRYGNQKVPSATSLSLGVQQNLGFDTVLDVSYVAKLGRHIAETVALNGIPEYSRFASANLDPTTGKVLNDNFFRPYPGWASLNEGETGLTSNYNALQASLRKRLAKNLSFGVSYSFAKDLSTTAWSQYFPSKARNYGRATIDRAQTGSINYSYDLPKLGHRLNNKILGAVTDNWTISGITSFSTGAPFTPGLTMSPAVDFTGSNEAARINVIGNGVLPADQRTFNQNFNTAAFAPPPRCSATYQNPACFGNAGVDILSGPGFSNWDITAGKRIPVGKNERRFFMLKIEAFNAFNHPEFNAYDTSAVFNASLVQTNKTFGALTGVTRSPRILSLDLRFQF